MLPVIRAAAFWMESRGQVRISGGRLHLGVAQQLADHRKALAERQRPRSIRMPEVMNAQIVQSCLSPNRKRSTSISPAACWRCPASWDPIPTPGSRSAPASAATAVAAPRGQLRRHPGRRGCARDRDQPGRRPGRGQGDQGEPRPGSETGAEAARAPPGDGAPVWLKTGHYGPFVAQRRRYAGVPEDLALDTLTLAQAVDLLDR